MARRIGIEKFIRVMAKESARQQRLQVQDARRRQQQRDRAQREAEREHTRNMRDTVRSDKERVKEEKALYLASRQQETQNLNEDVESRLDELRGILDETLSIDDTVDFDALRILDKPPVFSLPMDLIDPAAPPDRGSFIESIRPLGWFGRLLPGANRKHEKRLSKAEESYSEAHIQWQESEFARIEKVAGQRAEYENSLTAFEAMRKERDQEVDSFRDDYLAGDPGAIVAYVSMVLERSSYPEGFPQVFSVAYMAASQQVVVEYELPMVEVIPSVVEYRYAKTKDAIDEKPRKPADIKALYQDVVASISLRTIHEVFEADQGGHAQACCFNGFIHTVDPATGKDIQPHLISVRTTKEVFSNINLAKVDRQVCLRNLGAQVSRQPTEAQAVRPIVDFHMADARFVDQTDLLSGLDLSTNLMEMTPFQFEQLVANLFEQMGLESKLTRSSRDGGVDCIAFDRRPILGGKVVIQAKRYRHTVGVSAVRDLFGTMMNEGANKGILVTTSGYGPDAFSFSKDKPIELIDGGGLLFLLQESGVQARIVFPQE